MWRVKRGLRIFSFTNCPSQYTRVTYIFTCVSSTRRVCEGLSFASTTVWNQCVYRLLVYGREVKPATREHWILGRVVHIQVLDGVCSAHPRRGHEERHAQPVVHLKKTKYKKMDNDVVITMRTRVARCWCERRQLARKKAMSESKKTTDS